MCPIASPAIGGQPGDFKPGIEARLKPAFHPATGLLPAKPATRDAKVQVFPPLRHSAELPSGKPSSATPRICGCFKRRSCLGQLPWLRLFGAIAKDSQRKGLLHHIAHPMLRLNRRHLPDVGQGDSTSIIEKQAMHLIFDGAADGACGLRNLLVVSQSTRSI